MRPDWTWRCMPTAILVALAILSPACDGGGAGSGTETQDGIEIEGTWLSDFGSTEVITSTTWDNGFATATVESYDNDANVAILSGPSYNVDPDETDPPTVFAKIVWTDIADDGFAYCTAAFELATREDAETAEAVYDPGDPDTGCSGFPWTKLTAG